MRAALLLASALVLSACSGDGIFRDRNIRNIAIRNHRFEPAVTYVQADKPVQLIAEGVDETALVFASPDLGVAPTRLRPHVHHGRAGRLMSNDYRSMGEKFAFGPLKPGAYELVCDCHGERVTGTLVAR